MSTLASIKNQLVTCHTLLQVEDQDLIGLHIKTFPCPAAAWKGGEAIITDILSGKQAFRVESTHNGKQINLLRSDRIFIL